MRFGVRGQRGSAGRASRALGSGVPGAPRAEQGAGAGTNAAQERCRVAPQALGSDRLLSAARGPRRAPAAQAHPWHTDSNSEQIWMGWTLSSHDVGSLLGEGLSSIYSSVEKLKCFSSQFEEVLPRHSKFSDKPTLSALCIIAKVLPHQGC